MNGALTLSVLLGLAVGAAYLRGFKALRAGSQEEALLEFRSAVRLNPVSTRYRIGVVDALYARAPGNGSGAAARPPGRERLLRANGRGFAAGGGRGA